MSEIKDIFGNPLQINAVYSYIYSKSVKGHVKQNYRLNLKYLGYNPADKLLKFQMDNGSLKYLLNNNKYNNLELVTKAALEPPSAIPTQPPISEEKGSEEKGGKRRKSRKSKKSKKSRKSKKTKKSKKSRKSRR